ncbi:hypothetical protein [uncultured Aeromicrobium sp.]|uniref:hypothetical protein n=1 Tax=uncultured Aeromicrobium sp. TaxID=337820 RepID=UPI002601595E|nr:hypothetical protein [uncultured Aeromicrobium sp.]
MRPTRLTVRGIAASCAAVLVTFLVAASWPGTASQTRSSAGTAAASVSLGGDSSAASRAAAVQPDTVHDHDATAAGDQISAALGASMTFALTPLGLLSPASARTVNGRRRGSAQGRAPPA